MIGEMGGVRVPIVECTPLLASGRVGAVLVTTDGVEIERPSLSGSGRVCWCGLWVCYADTKISEE
jgi:hypothetical protein